MKNKTKKIKSKTVSSYRKWTTLKYTLYAGTYALPVVPAAIMTGLNWEEWVAQTGNNGWSLGLGFGSLLLALIITIVGIAKKDEIINEKLSKLYYFAIVLAVWAVALMFVASIIHQFGLMLLYVAIGVVGGATCDQANKMKVNSEVEFYKQAVRDNGLDPRYEKKRKKKEEILNRAKREKAEREAVE